MIKRAFLLLFLSAAATVAWTFLTLPDTRPLLKTNPSTSGIRRYREKQLEAKGKKPHSVMVWRNLSQISPYLVHAVIMAEDDSFYQHHGFDIEQTKRALQINWERRRFAFGGSTLTQQLARSLFLSPRKSLLRKGREALITRRLEKTLPKKRILELYLNVVEWGPEVYGAEAAAQHFFGKSAAALTPEEAISLAVILPSPRRWNPLGDTRFMNRRRSTLYVRMVRAHYIVPDPVPLVQPLPVTEPALTPGGPTLETPTETEPAPDEDDEEPEPADDRSVWRPSTSGG